MQSKDYAYAYHEAPPMECPRDGWRRLEICDMAEVDPIIQGLRAEMKNLGYPRKDSFAVGVALYKAVKNAVKYGNRGEKSRSVHLSYHTGREEVLLEVSDEGFGFDPRKVPNPLSDEHRGERPRGWGLLLMRVYMSWVRFNKRGNRVILCKRRSAV
jgi:serine/threonine-protein kinase RsbW